MSEAGGADFDFGRVVNRAFALVGRNFIAFASLSVLAVIPGVALAYFTAQRLQGGAASALTLNYWGIYLVTEVATIFLSFLLQAALTYASVMDLNGRPVSIAEAVTTALRAALPLLLLGILYSLGIGFALVLLIFPGLMLVTAWSVIVPVRIVENTGISESFSRSVRLTAGHRWAIFGILLIVWLGTAAVEFAARPLFGIAISAGAATTPSYSILVGVVHIFTYMISATIAASIYYELRSAKEGIGPEHLAAIFE
jgi:hypothetical protein